MQTFFPQTFRLRKNLYFLLYISFQQQINYEIYNFNWFLNENFKHKMFQYHNTKVFWYHQSIYYWQEQSWFKRAHFGEFLDTYNIRTLVNGGEKIKNVKFLQEMSSNQPRTLQRGWAASKDQQNKTDKFISVSTMSLWTVKLIITKWLRSIS